LGYSPQYSLVTFPLTSAIPYAFERYGGQRALQPLSLVTHCCGRGPPFVATSAMQLSRSPLHSLKHRCRADKGGGGGGTTGGGTSVSVTWQFPNHLRHAPVPVPSGMQTFPGAR
jgi:hypothetical protein